MLFAESLNSSLRKKNSNYLRKDKIQFFHVPFLAFLSEVSLTGLSSTFFGSRYCGYDQELELTVEKLPELQYQIIFSLAATDQLQVIGIVFFFY